MHFSVVIGDVVFRFALFGLLIYKLTTLVKAHVIPFLCQHIDEENKNIAALIEKEKLLTTMQHRLEENMANQKIQFTQLEKKARMWHTDLLARQSAQEIESTRLKQGLLRKREFQQREYSKIIFKKRIIPVAVASAYSSLSNQMNTSEGESLFRRLIGQLNTGK
jgi:hypothetical protein